MGHILFIYFGEYDCNKSDDNKFDYNNTYYKKLICKK